MFAHPVQASLRFSESRDPPDGHPCPTSLALDQRSAYRPFQECRHLCKAVNSVGQFAEFVTLVGVVNEVNFTARRFYALDNLFGLKERDARVVVPSQYQQRSPDSFRFSQW